VYDDSPIFHQAFHWAVNRLMLNGKRALQWRSWVLFACCASGILMEGRKKCSKVNELYPFMERAFTGLIPTNNLGGYRLIASKEVF
jgi:hypothetical protein